MKISRPSAALTAVAVLSPFFAVSAHAQVAPISTSPRMSCAAKPPAHLETAEKGDRGVEVTFTIDCDLTNANSESLDKIYRYFALSTRERIREPSVGPMADFAPVFGREYLQDRPTTESYVVRPNGLGREGGKEDLYADGTFHFARDVAPTGEKRVSISFVTEKLYCQAGFGDPVCRTRAVDGRSDYVYDPESRTIRVTTVGYVRAAVWGIFKSRVIKAAREGLSKETQLTALRFVKRGIVGDQGLATGLEKPAKK